MALNTASYRNSFSAINRRSNPLRRLIMLFLFIAGIVLWLTVLQQARPDFPDLLMQIFSVSAVGLASGLGARMALTQRNSLFRLVAALASLVMGLYGLGYLTDWKMGLGPLEFWRDRVDYNEAAQLGGGAIAALMALSAWPRSGVRSIETYSRSRSSTRAVPETTGSYHPVPQSSSSRGLASFLNPGTWAKRPTSVSPSRSVQRGRVSGRSRPSARSSPAVERLVVPRPSKRSKSRSKRKGIFRGKPEVQFSMYAEHKCPYCLEDVKRNDPRGVKECPVCHTLHHADCWSITGMCQVPHMNT